MTNKMSNTKVSRKVGDWKQWKSGWKYKKDAPQNRQWNKDRAKLFKKNGVFIDVKGIFSKEFFSGTNIVYWRL